MKCGIFFLCIVMYITIHEYVSNDLKCGKKRLHAKIHNIITIYIHYRTIYYNRNIIKSYKILQKLSPKHAAHGVAQSTYPIYTYGKACLSQRPSWSAAGDPRLARGRSQVRAPVPAGTLRGLFSPPSLPSFFGRVFLHIPHQPRKSVRVKTITCI